MGFLPLLADFNSQPSLRGRIRRGRGAFTENIIFVLRISVTLYFAEKSSSQLIACKERDGIQQIMPGGRYLNRQLDRAWPPGSVGVVDAS